MEEISIIELIILFLLLCLSALFSGSETAFTALSKLKVKQLQEKRPKLAPLFSLWLEEPHRLLTTILVGNNLVNIGASTLAASLATQYAQSAGMSNATAVGISFGAMSFFILVCGEIAPKVYAQQHPEKLSVFSIRFLRGLSYLLLPVVKFLIFFSGIIIRILGGKIGRPQPFLTDQEIRSLIYTAEKEKVIEKEEREMIEGVFEVGEKRVADIMVPRVDIFALEMGTTIKEAIERFKERKFSRIPVYRDSIDNIIGILYAKDILSYETLEKLNEVKVEDFLRRPMFVPKSKKLDELLKDFRKKRTHIAIVVDEYGVTAGLVTIEDILEEIVGEIVDEHEKEEKMWEVTSPNVIVVDAKLSIEEANEKLGLNLPEEEVETIGGIIMNRLGKVPEKGEILTYGNLKLIVLDADERKVKKVKIIKMKGENEEGKADEKNQR